jgi:inositol transport system permease protein
VAVDPRSDESQTSQLGAQSLFARLSRRTRDLSTMQTLARLAPLIVLMVISLVFAAMTPTFLRPANLFNVLRQISIIGLLAIGETFVILIAGIDLSVAALMGLTGMVAGTLESEHQILLLSLSVPLLIGVLAGLLQGVIAAKGKVPSFIVTLGGLQAFTGLTLLYSDGQPVAGFSETYQAIGQGTIGPVPIPVVLFLGLAIVSEFVLRKTAFGRHVYALGGNAEAARLSGLNVNFITIMTFVLAGLFAALGGIVLTARLGAGDPTIGGGPELLNVIAAVVIGGTSLFGGIGSVRGTIIGAVLIGVITNGLLLLNTSPYLQPVIIGAIIVVAVFVDQFFKART